MRSGSINIPCFMKILRALVIPAAFLLIPGKGQASEPAVIHIVTPSWTAQTHPDGSGLFFDILRAVYEPVGIELKFDIVPWKRAEEMVALKKADARLAVIRTHPDQLFPHYPLYVDRTMVVFKKQPGLKWGGVKDLDGRKVVWLRGYDYCNLSELKVIQMQWYEVDRPGQAWGMLLQGKADYYLDAEIDLLRYIADHDLNLGNYHIHKLLDRNAYVHFADTERSRWLMEIWDQRIIKLFKTGKLKNLFDKWGVRFRPEPFQDPPPGRPADGSGVK